jgi:hypothetical protein
MLSRFPYHEGLLHKAEAERAPNTRLMSLQLPTAAGVRREGEGIAPLPSPQLAEAVGIELPGSAELHGWQVGGFALSPQGLIALSEQISRSKASTTCAPSLLFFARLARLSFEVALAGALLPTARGWELDPRIVRRLAQQVGGAVPDVVCAQHHGKAGNVIRMALEAFARQLALEALRPAPFKAGFEPSEAAGRGAWIAALLGRAIFTAPPDIIRADDPSRMLAAYALARRRPQLAQVQEDTAQAIEQWAAPLCPQPAQVQGLIGLQLRLKAPDEGESWSLECLLSEEHQEERPSEPVVARTLERARGLCDVLAPLWVLPSSLRLSAGDVISLVKASESLAAQGFELDIPQELEEVAPIRSRAVVSAPEVESSGLLSVGALCQCHFEVGVAGEWLDEEELSALTSAKAPLVRVRGRWRRLGEGALERALGLISSGEQEVGVLHALRLAQGLDEASGQEAEEGKPDDTEGEPDADDGTTPDGEDVISEPPRVSESLRRLLSGTLAGSIQEAPTPATFRGELRSYQGFGLGWLQYMEERGFGACLADDMGLGKTIECLALLTAEREHTARAERGVTLLVVPFSAVSNWEEESEHFCPELAVHVHHGARRGAGGSLDKVLAGADVCLTTYHLLVRDLEELRAHEWHRLVLDEVQALKNDYTQAAQAAATIRARSRVALSGTPVENRLAELWSVMHLLNPGLLGSRQDFGREFVKPIEREEDQEAADRLSALVAPFILRRTKADPEIRRQLPAKIERTRACPLSADQAAMYTACVQEMLAEIERARPKDRRGLIFKAITQLKLICNHPLAFAEDGGPIKGRSGKLAELERIASDALAVGEKTLCFTQYPSFARRIAPYLSEQLGCEVDLFDGSLSATKRRALRTHFQEDEELGLLLVSYGAGGTALNLTAANHVVLFDRWWNPAVESQAADRAYRIGQRRDVYLHRLMCAGTIEERIEMMLERKKMLSDLVISSLGADIVSLDNKALSEMLSLTSRALSEDWSE